MKIVTLEELGALGPGTIFADFDPNGNNVDGLYRLYAVRRFKANEAILGCEKYYRDGQVIDFVYMDLLVQDDGNFGNPPKLEHADSVQRWGCYELEAKFVVYEQADIDRLCHVLRKENDVG